MKSRRAEQESGARKQRGIAGEKRSNIVALPPRKVDALVQSMEMTGITRSQVSSICRGIDERVQAFLQRPLEGEWPYLWLDATYVKVRKNGRVVSVAVIIAARTVAGR